MTILLMISQLGNYTPCLNLDMSAQTYQIELTALSSTKWTMQPFVTVYHTFTYTFCIHHTICQEMDIWMSRGISIADQIFTLQQTIEKVWDYDTGLYKIFVDFKQSYDMIDQEALYEAMVEIGIPLKLLR